MRNKLTLSFILVLIFSLTLIAQKKDEYGNYILKELNEKQALKLFGKPGERLAKSLGNPKLIKESIIQGNKVKTVLLTMVQFALQTT